nr:phospholipase d1 [Quercus suber]
MLRRRCSPSASLPVLRPATRRQRCEVQVHEVVILDWWCSPELYLRRPPAKNEKYRLDRLLFAAAARGVQINIIVYKEVTQALTLSSSHTKHWLEDNDPTGNIRVFRHPDHLPDKQTLASSFWSSIKESGMSAAKLGQLPGDALKGIYGMSEDTILYWAHHEKLCVVDGKTAFMGGLDLCYGRWDTNQHSIADAHPGDLDRIVFPGQDYNNARIMDFSDVQHWQNNKLDRTHNSRMGWSDISICLQGPVVQDLRAHFAQRWNFIYYEKYDVRKDARYHPIDYRPSRVGIVGHPYSQEFPGAEVEGEGQ